MDAIINNKGVSIPVNVDPQAYIADVLTKDTPDNN